MFPSRRAIFFPFQRRNVRNFLYLKYFILFFLSLLLDNVSKFNTRFLDNLGVSKCDENVRTIKVKFSARFGTDHLRIMMKRSTFVCIRASLRVLIVSRHATRVAYESSAALKRERGEGRRKGLTTTTPCLPPPLPLRALFVILLFRRRVH